MKWFRFEKGRQNTGYEKLCLMQAYWLPIPIDLYLLRYREGAYIPEHTDTVSGYRHYRLNIVCKKARQGGIFTSAHKVFQRGRLTLFRSDKPHAVSRIIEGTRYVLSLGICTKKKGAHT